MQDKVRPLTRSDEGLAYTPEDRAWQIYLSRTVHGLNDDEIKDQLQFSNKEFELCSALEITLRRKFAAKKIKNKA